MKHMPSALLVKFQLLNLLDRAYTTVLLKQNYIKIEDEVTLKFELLETTLSINFSIKNWKVLLSIYTF